MSDWNKKATKFFMIVTAVGIIVVTFVLLVSGSIILSKIH